MSRNVAGISLCAIGCLATLAAFLYLIFLRIEVGSLRAHAEEARLEWAAREEDA